ARSGPGPEGGGGSPSDGGTGRRVDGSCAPDPARAMFARGRRAPDLRAPRRGAGALRPRPRHLPRAHRSRAGGESGRRRPGGPVHDGRRRAGVVADATLAVGRPAPRPAIPEWLEAVLLRLVAVVVALTLCGVLLIVQGHNPWVAYTDMASGAFGSRYALEQTLLKAIPLMLTTLGVMITFTAGLWNIGAEGQLTIGALAASWLALRHCTAPALVLLPGMALLGMLGGALWALVPAVPRAYVGMNEVISTLLLNYIALLILDYLVFGPWADPTAFNFPYSPAFSDAARLPMLFGEVLLGLVFALLAPAVVAAVIGLTVWGYEIRTSGASPGAARYAGMPLTRNILVAMAASGALSGLAGMAEVSGMIFRVQH